MSSLKQSYDKIADPRKFPIQRTFTLDGTLTGDNNMDVNGSVTPVEFYFQAEPNRMVYINKLGFLISDSGNTDFDNYGSLPGPLTNGITLYTIIDGVEIPLSPIIKKTADYFGIGASAQFVDLSGSSRLANYTFSLFDYSEGIILNGDNGDILGIRINDNFTSLDLHTCSLDGYFQFKAV